jgi:hypothetical protein
MGPGKDKNMSLNPGPYFVGLTVDEAFPLFAISLVGFGISEGEIKTARLCLPVGSHICYFPMQIVRSLISTIGWLVWIYRESW